MVFPAPGPGRTAALCLLAVAACRSPAPTLPTPAAPGPLDVVIEGGRIVDGSGNPWFHGDVGIRRDLAAILKEQRKTNRTMSAALWVGMGFVMGLLVAQLLLKLHMAGFI